MPLENHDEIHTSDTLNELRQLGYRGESKFSAVHRLVLDGRIPSRRDGRARMIARSDLPAIAAALGLKAPEPVSA